MQRSCFLGKLKLLSLGAVAFMPYSVSAQELLLDRQPGTCSQLKLFVTKQGVADVTGTRRKGIWGWTVFRPLINGFALDEIGQYPGAFTFYSQPVEEGMGGLGLCLKMTKLDLKFQAETDMSRIEWEHKMPPGSQVCKGMGPCGETS
jgi:hypothetical protein